MSARRDAAEDWSAPWFAPYRGLLDALAPDISQHRWSACITQLNDRASDAGLHNDHGKPLRFVAPDAAGGAAYEAHIWETGAVPTRCDPAGVWHDLFNALVWLTFPRIKARLNALQARAIAAAGVGPGRGGLRDAATLLDENGAVVLSRDPELVDALRRFDWRTLFVADRARFARAMQVVVVGHALLDKLRAPYKAICAHAWVLDDGMGAGLDVHAANSLDDALRPAAMSPLPVLGVPGWWPGNADPEFYEDARVFRASRAHARTTPAG